MATRVALKALIDSNLQSGTNITASEHRAVETAIVDSCKPYNVGYFTLGDVAGTTGSLPVYGALSATASILFSNMSKIVVVFNTATPMPSTNYYVRMFVKSNQNTAQSGYDTYTPYFANVSTTGFDAYVRESSNGVQSLTIYFEAIPLD